MLDWPTSMNWFRSILQALSVSGASFAKESCTCSGGTQITPSVRHTSELPEVYSHSRPASLRSTSAGPSAAGSDFPSFALGVRHPAISRSNCSMSRPS